MTPQQLTATVEYSRHLAGNFLSLALRSMIHSLLEDKQYRGPVDLHWGMRFQDDLFWVQEFENLATSFSNFKFDISLSKVDDRWHACWGHVNDCLVKHYQTFSG